MIKRAMALVLAGFYIHIICEMFVSRSTYNGKYFKTGGEWKHPSSGL